jgi:hypothetical protein
MQLHKLLILCLLCCLPAFAFGQTIKLQQLEPSATVEGTKAGQLGLTGTSGRQQYAQYTEVNGTPVGYIPAATGNTNNLSEFVTGSDGNKYYIDWQGNAMQIGGGGGSITPINGITNITTPSVGTGLGGTLIKNTLIDGNQFSFDWTDLVYWRSNTSNTVSGGEVDLLLQPVGTSSILRGRVDHNGASGSNRRGELQVNPLSINNPGDQVYLGFGTSLTTWSDETLVGTGAGVSIGDDEAQMSYIDFVGGTSRAFSVNVTGHRMIGIDAATASKMLYFNPTTNEVTQGDPPATPTLYYQTVANSVADLTQRPKIRFQGQANNQIAVTAADDSGNNETDVTVQLSIGTFGELNYAPGTTNWTIIDNAITNNKILNGTIQPAKFAQSTAVDGSAYYYASTAWTIGTNVQSVRRITQNGTGSTVNVNNDNFESYQIDGTFSNNWNLTWTFTPGGGTTGTQALNPIRYVANLSTTQPFTLARGTGPTWQFKDISGAAAANSMTVSPGKKYQLVYDAAANLVRVTMIN